MTLNVSPGDLSRLALQACRQLLDWAQSGRLQPGDHLTELALCTRLGMSRTPVRAALGHLHRLGLLAHAPRQGYTLRASRPQLLRAVRALPQDESSTLYYRILQQRTAGQLGTLVTERELAQRFDTRPSLVRDVLMRLLQHGILRGRRGMRWEFAETLDSTDSERESYRFRLMLECAALHEPSFAIESQRLAACRQRQEELLANATRHSWLDFFEANAEFHELLASASGNRFVLRAVQEQNRLRRVSDLMDYPVVDVEMLRRSCREHLELLNAIERGKQAEAAVLMRQHLLRASDVLEQRVAGAL